MSRIEVGYGLEGALPDAKTGRIQDNSMIPFFRDGGYGIGIYSGFLAIVKEVYAEYGIEYEPAGYTIIMMANTRKAIQMRAAFCFSYLYLFWLL